MGRDLDSGSRSEPLGRPERENPRSLKPLADGTVGHSRDNIALCKGHWTNYGGFTMAMKNHMGNLCSGADSTATGPRITCWPSTRPRRFLGRDG